MKNSDKSKGENKDHLSPTNPEEYKDKTPVSTPQKSENLTHKELQDRYEVYQSIGEMMNYPNTVHDLKEQYSAERDETQKDRVQANAYYVHGKQAGLNQAPPESIERSREIEDQTHRDEKTKELDDRYDQGPNLRGEFEEQQPSETKQEFDKSKDNSQPKPNQPGQDLADKKSEETNIPSQNERDSRHEIYGRIGEIMHEAHVLSDIQEKYNDHVDKVGEAQKQADKQLSKGEEVEVSQDTRETIKAAQEMQDQDIGDLVRKEQEGRPQERESFASRFQEEQPSPRDIKQEFKETINKGMDRER